MTKTSNPVNDIPSVLADLEKSIRDAGAWCVTLKDRQPVHYYICKNPKSSMAISLCASKVIPINSLVAQEPVIKCLVCEAYHTVREEVKLKHERTLTHISIAKQVQLDLLSTQPTEKE